MRNGMRIGAAAALLPFMLSFAACSSYKAANRENFEGALNRYYADHDECLYPEGLRFPYEVSTRGATAPLTKELDALTDAGLLERSEEKAIQVKRYTLTAYARSRVTDRFCYGHRRITGIDSFTPPAMVDGRQVSRVEYAYKMMDVPGWAQSEKMREAFPALAKSTTGEPRSTSVLVLTVNGWQVPE